jgi:peptide/nickel transport system substrate-binding protein
VNLLRRLSTRRLQIIGASAFLLILVTSCAARKTAAIPTAASTAEATPGPHTPEISFALIGNVTAANVWSLFDATGYSYNNYAVRSDYWPRLYRLSIPGQQFEPLAASALPSSVQAEGNFYTAIIPLRSDLNWTDGSPFTADDVAFTVNTVLSFQLGFDWHDYYNPDWLDHAEAVDAHAVKFYFKKTPNVAVWHYSALQGPVLQKAYWAPRIADSTALLPSADLHSQIDALKIKVSDLQTRVDALNATLATETGDAARQTQAGIIHQKGDLDKAINDLSKVQTVFDAAMKAGRAMLYSLDDRNEPRLGEWNYKASGNNFVENEANLKYPLGQQGMNQITYHIYPTEAVALTAYSNGEVDAILLPGGLSSASLAVNPSLKTVMKSSGHSLRFLVINPLFGALNDPAFHQALACVIDQEELAGRLNGQVEPLESYVLPTESPWINQDAALPCKGLDDAARIKQAGQILNSAGYTWKQEPAANAAGQKLTMPNGTTFPNVTLMVPSDDDLRVAAASYIQHQAQMLGISMTARSVSSIDLNYAVLGSQDYAMALLGWHVSSYPGYLCDWFGDGNQFNYDGNQIKTICETLDVTSDLDTAHQQVLEIQSVLARDLPFIPLYSGVTYDAYRNMTYPFEQVPDGLSGIYGAPALAVPVKP